MMWSRSSRKKKEKNEITIALCSCAINKKLSTPCDFHWYDVIWERVKNPLKLMFGSGFVWCLRKSQRKSWEITFVPFLSGINEITLERNFPAKKYFFEVEWIAKGRKMIIYSTKHLNGLLFGIFHTRKDVM